MAVVAELAAAVDARGEDDGESDDDDRDDDGEDDRPRRNCKDASVRGHSIKHWGKEGRGSYLGTWCEGWWQCILSRHFRRHTDRRNRTSNSTACTHRCRTDPCTLKRKHSPGMQLSSIRQLH